MADIITRCERAGLNVYESDVSLVYARDDKTLVATIERDVIVWETDTTPAKWSRLFFDAEHRQPKQAMHRLIRRRPGGTEIMDALEAVNGLIRSARHHEQPKLAELAEGVLDLLDDAKTSIGDDIRREYGL